MRNQDKLLASAACLCALLCCPRPAAAQIQIISDQSTTSLSYAGEAPSPSGVNAELETSLLRDTNVFSNNERPFSDFIFQEGALVNLWKTEPRWNLALQYRPTLMAYDNETSLDNFDQSLDFTGQYSFTQRLRFRGTENFGYFTGFLQPISDEYFSLPTSPFGTLNSNLIVPTSRDLSEGSEGHIDYDVSPRGSLDLMGGYAIQNFSGINSPQQGVLPADLLNTSGTTGGASYQYRVTQEFTLGARYVYQSFHYGLGGSDETNTAFATAHWSVGPRVDFDLYGGPSFSRTYGGPYLAPSESETTVSFNTLGPSVGGTFTLRSDQTVFDITAQRSVSSGGGLLMTVTDSYEGAEFRRQLGDNWDFVLIANNARSVALQTEPDRGKVESDSAGAAFEHPLFSKLSVHFEYDYLRQRVNNYVPLGTNVNESQYVVSLFYRLGEPRL
ncbi:MAG TPA: hypothetical protein VMB47_09515 [Candidatus Aquilonibacter sp.]|nr:hypothetical protein [Candidatus Aquilonibacter sp.]